MICLYSGFALGVNDVVMVTKPKGYLASAGRILYFTGPFAGAAATFAATTCIAHSIRGKDDTTNYVLGALGSSAVIGTWLRSAYFGGWSAVILSVAAYMKKRSVDEGWVFFPPSTNMDRKIWNGPTPDFSARKEFDRK